MTLLGSAAALVQTQTALAQTAPILPNGGRVVAGDVTIGTPAGGTLTVTQRTLTGIVNWTGFSIGTGGTVRFENGSGATLNRVDGGGMSRIDGSLLASGSVYLINPSGIIVGKNGIVSVGGSFVASTLGIADQAFLAGGDRTLAGPSTAAVVNLGRIGALGGDVALIAASVSNNGTLAAANGTVALAAGASVLIRDTALDGGRFVVLVGGPGSSATNTGTIAATVAELRAAGGSVYALAGNVSGIVAADTVTGENGRVFLTAGEGGSVAVGDAAITSRTPSYGGVVEISGGTVALAANSRIDVSAASGGGQVYVTSQGGLSATGTILARGTDQGGTVWTIGRALDVAGATVDTRGAAVGSWLVEQPGLTIDSRLAGNVDRILKTTNLEFSANPADLGGDPAEGSLVIAAPISFGGPNQLTLTSTNVLRVNQNVTVAGSGVLNLNLYGADDFGAPIVFAANRSITFTGPAGGGRALTVNGAPYTLIDSLAGLKAISDNPTGHYAVARSFSVGGAVLDGPVAGASGSDSFSGMFEGLGHTINGLRIDAPGKSDVGLFGIVSGSIRNLALVGGSVTGGSDVGALAGRLDMGSVAYVSSSVSVSRRGGDSGSGIGGLIGYVYEGQVAGSSATGAVDGQSGGFVGGLVGGGYGLSVVDSFATGDVRGGDNTGGLVGSMARSGIDSSYATGVVTGRQAVGGLVGIATLSGIRASRAGGRVSGMAQVGGLAGSTADSTIEDSIASGNVNASVDRGGGLVGELDYGDVTRSSASGRVTGGATLGGLVGTMFLSTVTDGSASGAVTATGGRAGGLIGEANESNVLRGSATGAVRGAGSVGGLIGIATAADPTYEAFGTYADSRASGMVNGMSDVGGLIGTAINIRLTGGRANGAVTGAASGANAGGLVGKASGATIINAEASGRVTGSINIGGLVGLSERTAIDTAAATNPVRGQTNVGGLIGHRAGGSLTAVSATGPVSGSRNVGPLIGLDDPAP